MFEINPEHGRLHIIVLLIYQLKYLRLLLTIISQKSIYGDILWFQH